MSIVATPRTSAVSSLFPRPPSVTSSARSGDGERRDMLPVVLMRRLRDRVRRRGAYRSQGTPVLRVLWRDPLTGQVRAHLDAVRWQVGFIQTLPALQGNRRPLRVW